MLTHCKSIQAQNVDQELVDYYVNLVNSRLAGEQHFEFPTDARMYEPENKTVEGTIFIDIWNIFLFLKFV